MAIPTVQAVYNAARSVLGDDQITGGEVFFNSILEPHYVTAFAELYRAMQSAQNPRIQCANYWNVPANTGYISPATMGITNLGEIETIWERGNVSSWNISAITPGTGACTVTSAATTLATGNQAVVYLAGGITEDINDIWTVTVNSATSTQLNGCTATGAYTSGGALSYSAEKFLEMAPRTAIDWTDQAPTSSFQVYAWEKDIIRVPPVSTVRQIKVTYTLSGDAPTATTASTGIDDCLDFLKYRIAGMAGPSKGMLVRAQQYQLLAVGPDWVSRGIPGGILGQLLSSGVRNMQRLPPYLRQPPPYGVNRSRRWRAW